MYYCGHGNFNLPQAFLPPAVGAYSNYYTQYAGSYPYFPYADKVDVLSTSRSDIPNLGYTEMIVEGDTLPVTGAVPSGLDGNAVYQGFYNIHHTDDTTHHFKDNKNKDASIAFYSRYDSSPPPVTTDPARVRFAPRIMAKLELGENPGILEIYFYILSINPFY